MAESSLFTKFKLRGVEFRNRAWVSPMCQYSSANGMPADWHLVHLGSRAVGGAGLVLLEATGVAPEGRISPGDLGLWSEEHAEAFAPIVRFIHDQGAVAGVQLAHAGRKASTAPPWKGGLEVPLQEGGWMPLAPSSLRFAEGYPLPRAMTLNHLREIVRRFSDAGGFARRAGFKVVELHFAHGYLVHEFLSPLSNHRTDDYGGSLDNRMRLALEIAAAVRAVWPEDRPLFARVSATDWVEGGWDLPSTLELARRLKDLGVDLIDCSSGGSSPAAQIPAAPGFQVPFAEAVRKETGIATAAVGLITAPRQAEEIVASKKADAVFLARQFLRDPYWPLHAAKELGADVPWPVQYSRAKT